MGHKLELALGKSWVVPSVRYSHPGAWSVGGECIQDASPEWVGEAGHPEGFIGSPWWQVCALVGAQPAPEPELGAWGHTKKGQWCVSGTSERR